MLAPTDVARLTEPPGELKRRPDGARYYDGELIITHLNYALGPAGWDWAEQDRGFDADADEVWVLGQLTARIVVTDGEVSAVLTTTKLERGWQPVNRKRDGSAVSLGNDYKGAATDALKRCARLLGVGLDAWSKATPASAPRPAPERPAPIIHEPPAPDPGLTPSDRLGAVARYVDLLAQAQQRDFRASWTGAEPRRWSDVQLAKYIGLLENFLARTGAA